MPEPMDLDALRRRIGLAKDCDCDAPEVFDALVAELRATRSREVQLRAMEGIQRAAKMEALTRAERAEAELAEERQVAEGYASDVTHYQAAIARVEALLSIHLDGDGGTWRINPMDLRAALRGDQ